MKHWKITSNHTVREMAILAFYIGLHSSRFRITFIFLWALFAVIYVPQTGSGFGLILVYLLIGAVLCGAYCFLALTITSLVFMEGIRKSGLITGHIEHDMGEEGIRQRSDSFEVALSWSAIKSVTMFKRYIVIESKTPTFFITLKKQGFESEQDCNKFYREAKAAIGQRDSRKDRLQTQRLECEAQDEILDDEVTAELRTKLGRQPTRTEVEAYRWSR